MAQQIQSSPRGYKLTPGIDIQVIIMALALQHNAFGQGQRCTIAHVEGSLQAISIQSLAQHAEGIGTIQATIRHTDIGTLLRGGGLKITQIGFCIAQLHDAAFTGEYITGTGNSSPGKDQGIRYGAAFKAQGSGAVQTGKGRVFYGHGAAGFSSDSAHGRAGIRTLLHFGQNGTGSSIGDESIINKAGVHSFTKDYFLSHPAAVLHSQGSLREGEHRAVIIRKLQPDCGRLFTSSHNHLGGRNGRPIQGVQIRDIVRFFNGTGIHLRGCDERRGYIAVCIEGDINRSAHSHDAGAPGSGNIQQLIAPGTRSAGEDGSESGQIQIDRHGNAAVGSGDRFRQRKRSIAGKGHCGGIHCI